VWLARYYVAPLGLTLAAMMPAAVKKKTGSAAVLKARFVGAAGVRNKKAAALAERVAAHFAGRAPGGEALRADELVAALGLSSGAGLRTLARHGVLELFREEQATPRGRGFDPLADEPASLARTTQAKPDLTPDQDTAVCGLREAVERGGFGVHVLFGVTGSGKTEVYLRVIERALALGKRALVLVPEIALTPQTSERFVRRFGARAVSVMHSALSATRRHEAWQRAAVGEARVVVGARSALFAPLTDLGVIVVDEEHDDSYKQDTAPRYHGRDAAIKRAAIEGCPVVLGSATPALETWLHTRPSGGKAPAWRLWKLGSRVPGAVLPGVRVVDMRQEAKLRAAMPGAAARSRHLLGPTLEGALEATLREGRQAILLLNRRGLAHHLACPSGGCGFVVMCDGCDAALVVHKSVAAPAGSLVRCHHCLTEVKTPALCPACGRRLTHAGGGTQGLEEELTRKFASLGIGSGTMLRVDSDTMKGLRDYFEAMRRFGEGEVRILLGTQMIAKGLDFPNVGLVGVIDADTALSLPDYRASERTFQLLSQVAGRSGRGGDPGGVIVQTWNPGHNAVRLAAAHDYESFAAGELAVRERAALPPYWKLARIVCEHGEARAASRVAGEAAAALRQTPEALAGRVRVEGPSPCIVSRIAHAHRFEVLVVAAGAGVLRDVLGRARACGLLAFSGRGKGKVSVDVNPTGLM
jgi:primosomal protein N' (replication factor Y)